jgi:cob(I)alamin adenosyltransferase
LSGTEMGKGLISIFTGDGKGKTTAALGSALRASGHGMKTIVIQFVKGDPDCGEHLFASKYRLFDIIQLAKGDSFHMSKEDLKRVAGETLRYAAKAIAGGQYQMVILDEILVAIKKGLLSTAEVVDLVNRKPQSVELILTGRYAPPEIIEIADLVTEMRLVKHPFRRGIAARRGIEF